MGISPAIAICGQMREDASAKASEKNEEPVLRVPLLCHAPLRLEAWWGLFYSVKRGGQCTHTTCLPFLSFFSSPRPSISTTGRLHPRNESLLFLLSIRQHQRQGMLYYIYICPFSVLSALLHLAPLRPHALLPSLPLPAYIPPKNKTIETRQITPSPSLPPSLKTYPVIILSSFAYICTVPSPFHSDKMLFTSRPFNPS